jgi:serine/threonine protein kinase
MFTLSKLCKKTGANPLLINAVFFLCHCRCSILELFELNHCKNERPILQILKQHPYIVNIVSSFQDVRIIYFLMDYYPGGNLMRLLSLGKLSVSHARQITAQVRLSPPTPIPPPLPPVNSLPSNQLAHVSLIFPTQLIVALEFMHNVGIAHRDLQPSNILFDEHGFIRVCDFNSGVVLSLQPGARAYSTVGCPFYMSPEVIKARGHGIAADWWSLGCIVFEMLTGYPPFYDVNRLGCFQKVPLACVHCPARVTPLFPLFRFCWGMSIALHQCIPSPKILRCVAFAPTRVLAFRQAKPTYSAATSSARTRGSKILTGMQSKPSLLFQSGSRLQRLMERWICGANHSQIILRTNASHGALFNPGMLLMSRMRRLQPSMSRLGPRWRAQKRILSLIFSEPTAL